METKETKTPKTTAKNQPEPTPETKPVEATPAQPEQPEQPAPAPVSLPEPPPQTSAPARVEKVDTGLAAFANEANFAHTQRVALALSKSSMIPASYQGNVPNILVAISLANRMNLDPLAVMQNVDIIHGRPGWKATFCISAVNGLGQFSPLRFRYSGEGENRKCYAYAKDLATGEIVEGPEASIKMARSEGWYDRKGSKWPTMPDLMLSYRAGTFFSRLYAPGVLNGMQTIDEIQDVGYTEISSNTGGINKLNSILKKKAPETETVAYEIVDNEADPNGTGI